MAEHDPDPKNALLSELESIKGLLNEQNTDDSVPDLDRIPVLREVIESIEPVPEDKPHQSPLFPEASSQPQHSNRPVQAKGENPFLPPHIKARLQGNRPAHPEPEDAEQTETIIEKSTEARSDQGSALQSTTGRSELIEALIEEFRPLLEARLKARLETMTDRQLKALRS